MIGKAIPSTRTVLLIRLNDKVFVKYVTNSTIAMTATMIPTINPYFSFLQKIVGWLDSYQQNLNFLLKIIYHTKPNAIPIAAIKKPP